MVLQLLLKIHVSADKIIIKFQLEMKRDNVKAVQLLMLKMEMVNLTTIANFLIRLETRQPQQNLTPLDVYVFQLVRDQ